MEQTRAVRSPRRAHPCSIPTSAFAGFRFPLEVITVSVRWYLRFGLSYRDVEELLAERGIEVDHVTIYRWVQRFAPDFAEAAGVRRHVVGDRWFVDETYVKVGGAWRYLFRAIDQFGQVIDVFLSPRRNSEDARQFFVQALDRTRISPTEVTTDRYRLYPRLVEELLPAAVHRGKPSMMKPKFQSCSLRRRWTTAATRSSETSSPAATLRRTWAPSLVWCWTSSGRCRRR
jgi:transposase-like protein